MTRRLFSSALALATLLPLAAPAQGDVSLKNEVQAAIHRGLHYLVAQQNQTSGAIGDPDYPAITALAAMALQGNPEASPDTLSPPAQKAYTFLLANQKPDGGIYAKSLPNYNTSLALTALTMAPGDRYREAALKARRLVTSSRNAVAPSYLQKRVLQDLPLPRVALAPATATTTALMMMALAAAVPAAARAAARAAAPARQSAPPRPRSRTPSE